MAALPAGARFEPLMTCYLTDATDPEEVARGYRGRVFAAVKLYPARATTNSAFGVTDYDRISPVLERMAGLGMPLLIHGEVTDPEVDVFDREAVFIDRVLDPLRRRLPELRIVLEHITTEEAVDYVMSGGREPGGDDHRPSPGHQSQRDICGRDPAAPLLPADRQAGEASPGAAPRRDIGRQQVFSRHRQRAARGSDQGNGLRLRRHLHRALRPRDLRRSLRGRSGARPARSLRLAERPGILRVAAQRGARHLAPRAFPGAGAHRRGRTAPSSHSAPAKRCAGALSD